MKNEVKVGVIGLGNRGLSMLKLIIMKIEGVKVEAVCDVYEDRAKAGADAVEAKQGKRPLMTLDYKDVLAADVDAVFILSSWDGHIKIAIEAMRAGKYVATEVGGAYSLDDCFDLVAASEETGKPCMLLENCCYGRKELAVLNAVRKGVFGEVVHCSGGYHHDLRNEITFGRENRHYRLNEYLNRNCENYPTHELGPIANVININRGNRMINLVSFSSKARGLHQYVEDKKSDDKELLAAEFKQGDVITTVINCENGETVVLTLDTSLPRTYSRGFTVRGTKAAYFEDNDSHFLDGKHNKFEFAPRLLWGNGKRFVKKYDHPVWTMCRKGLVKAGHGGMDWIVFNAFIEAVKLEEQTPIDVYDTAAWMAVTALSDASIKGGNVRVDFPDFTHGLYKQPREKLKNKYSLN